MDIDAELFTSIISDSSSRFELWEKFMNKRDVRIVIEVGVWKGSFAKEILEHCPTIERYFMIDPWASLPDWNKPFNVDSEAFDKAYQETMDKTAFAADKRVILRGRTQDVIDEIADGSLDFAYIDGDHTLRGITIDLIKLFPKIKENGFIAGDDFDLNPWQHDPSFEPTLVCPFSAYFAEAMDFPFIVLPFKQFLIQKKSNSKFSFVDHTGLYRDISLSRSLRQSDKSISKTIKQFMAKINIFKE